MPYVVDSQAGKRGGLIMPKYIAITTVDANQKSIVDGLREAGYSVEIIGKPVDLLVADPKSCINFLFEVKRVGYKPRKDQKKQQDWIKSWPGQVRVIETAEEAIAVVTNSYREQP